MKFNKFLLLLILITLIINIVNCKTTSTVKPTIKPTVKPTLEPSTTTTTTEEEESKGNVETDTSSLHESEAIKDSDESSISTDGKSKPTTKPKAFDPKELYLCGDDVSVEDEYDSFNGVVSTVSDDPYQCFLSSKNIGGSSKGMTLTLESKTCPTGCLGHKYSCAEVEHSTKMTYGTYSVVMASSPASNTVTKIYASTGGKGQYSDIFFKIEGNTTTLKYGYTSYGKVTEFKNTISGSSFDIANNYTFVYSQDTLVWYFNTRLQGEINTKYAGPKSPPPPLKFRISVTNNENKPIKESVLPSKATVKSFNYVSVKCPTDSESDEETNWGPQKASYKYFSSNCTTYRPYWIFNDTLNEEEGWTTELSNGTYREQAVYFQRIGYNIAFGFNEYAKNLRFSNRKAFPIKRHKYLMFWMNGGYRGGQSLAIFLTYKKNKIASVNLGDFIIGGIQKEHWYKVIIPMKSFQVTNPSNTNMDGFMIQPTFDGYMDMAYFDDVMFSNGSICMDPNEQMDVYKNGKLGNGDPSQSVANVNFASTAMKYKNKPTIEYQIENINRLQLNFMNGSIGIDEYDGMIFNLFYYPDNAYIYQGQEDLEQHTYTRPLDCQICLLNEAGTNEYPCLSLSEYVGGIFPSNKWVQLSIPWNDLAVDFYGARIGGVVVKTDLGGIHQGTLYISTITASHYKPPHVDESDSSFAIKLSLSYKLLLSLITITLYLLF